jgi:hypothetical protein
MPKNAEGIVSAPLTNDEVERYLGGNVFSIDILFDGDFAIRCPLCRKYWTLEMMEEWIKMTASLPMIVIA